MYPSDSPSLRRTIYVLLITVAAGGVAGRILAVTTQADNDRSRWDTVRALVDNGTYAIGHRDINPATGKYVDRGISTEEGWQTIDKVLHPETHDFYSSKPPLLATLVAGEYWLLKQTLGWSITDQLAEIVRTILITTNGMLLVVYWILLARLVEQFGTSEWGRLYVLAAGCFATFMSTFAITFNNHSVAACSVLFALYPFLQIWYGSRRGAGLFMAAGFFAMFTAVNELPAASFAVVLLLLLLYQAPARTLLFSIPAAAIPVAGALVTNYLAIGQLRPAYSEFGGPWYEFEGSHWTVLGRGIDWAYLSESRADYAFHVLVGHHGIFSLTPIFLLTLVGMVCGLVSRPSKRQSVEGSPLKTEHEGTPRLQMVALLTLLVSVIVVGFYVAWVNDRNRNYGGWTSGLRWLIWLTPLWLVTMLPVADWLAPRRWGRGLAYLLLGVSVLSVTYPALNPWRHPWLYKFLETRGWINY
jgi:hypothetical protein